MEEQRAPSIGKIATKYGLILGVLSFVLFIVIAMTGMKQGWMTSAISIALLVVLIVLAHGEFKKTHEGMMTYPQGLGSGTLVAIVATVLSTVLVFVYVKFINTGYSAAALKAQQTALEAQGMSGAQLDQALRMTSAMLTPVGIVITSLVAGVIMGFIVSVIVSVFTRKGDPRAVV